MKPILLSTALAVAMGLSAAYADSHGSADDLKAALEQSDEQISALNDSMAALTAERDQLHQALQAGQKQQGQSAQSLKSLAAARNKLFSELKKAQLDAAAERERLNATIDNLAADRNKLFAEYRGEQSKAAADAERMQDHILGLYDTRDSLKEQLAAAQAESASSAESLNAKIAAGEQSQEGLIDQLIELRNSSDEKIAAAEAKVTALDAQVAGNKATAETQEGLMDQLIDLRNATDDRITALEADLADAQRQNRVLTNVNNSAKNMINSARSQLQEANAQVAAAANPSSDSSAWADSVADKLRTKVGSLAGTQVNTPGGDTVKVRVGNNGLFESGGIALSDNGKQVLWVIGDALESVIDTRITIEGHTDSRPVSSSSRFANNWELSFARASSALAHLRTNVGIPPERLSVAGASDKFPIADNDSATGREQNRRVEIVLTPMK